MEFNPPESPDRASLRTSDRTPDRTQDRTQDRTRDQTSARTPARTSDRTQEGRSPARVPGRPSNRDRERAHDPPQDRAPGRVLGLDFGSRRIGVAVSDELGLTAQPVLTLSRKNLRQDLRALSRLMRKHACEEVVVGEPLYPSGDPSPQARRAQSFARELARETGAPVSLWDERLSTAQAHRYLDASGRPPGARRAVIDQVAAVLILQSFLDARAFRGTRPEVQAERRRGEKAIVV